jgi:ribosomal protein S18 acetylase RimI-like enzyme
VRLRRYRPSDAAIVRRLHFEGLDQVGVNRPGPWDTDLDRIEDEYLRCGDFVVAEVEGELVAMGGLRAVGPGTGELKRLRVAPRHQRRGLGEAITRALIARAQQLRFERLVLDTTTRQAPARALYRKLGFREMGRREMASGLELVFYELQLK